VVFGAAAVTPAAVAGRAVAVIDVLRASTSIAAALAHGARAVVPLPDPATVAERARGYARVDVVLAGERQMRPVAGFAIGNSPDDFTADAVAGRTVLLATTNGTPALAAAAAAGARQVCSAAFVNLAAATHVLRTALRGGLGVTIVCAGQDGRFALEDAACAGRIVRALGRRPRGAEPPALDDAARACALLDRRYRDRFDRLWGRCGTRARARPGGVRGRPRGVCRGRPLPGRPALVDGRLVASGVRAPAAGAGPAA
jgi:2-phosphosulfolactate phosphatase